MVSVLIRPAAKKGRKTNAERKLEMKIEEFLMLRKMARRYEKMKAELKETFCETDQLVGKYAVTFTEEYRDGYTVDPFSFNRMNITKVK